MTIETPDGVRLAYDIDGEGEPALVFVHGWCCNRSHWDAQMAAFRGRHRVVAMDLGGQGESEGERDQWTTESFGKDVVTVVEELQLEKVILVGHSMGGSVIVEAATRMPERVIGLVGADTFQQMGSVRTPEQVEERVAPFIRGPFEKAARYFAASMFIDESDPVLVKQTVKKMAKTIEHVGIQALRSLSHYEATLQKHLRALKIPVVTINAASQNTDVKRPRSTVLESDSWKEWGTS